MCCAASFWIVSASSWSLIEGSEIFFTITECPLTAVATDFDLIWVSVNNLAMALETVPESTIMESTTMSGAIGSSPMCATSIPTRVFLSSTALMLEEPTSRPTIVFDPIPNMCPPFCSEVRFPNSSFARVYGVPAAFTAALIFLPLRVSVATDFSSIHSSSFDFLKRQRLPNLNAGICCSFTYLYKVSGLTPRYCEACRMFITSRESAIHVSLRVRAYFGVLSISQTEARASPRQLPGFVGIYGVFLDSTKSGLAENLCRLYLFKLLPP